MKKIFKRIFLIIIFLIIASVTQVFAKWYLSSNTLSFEIKIIGDEEPPKITTQTESSITSDSFVLNFSGTDNQSGITEINIYMKRQKDTEYTLYNTKTYSNVLTINETYTVDGLVKYGIYEYYIVAKDSAGNVLTTEVKSVELDRIATEVTNPGNSKVELVPGVYEVVLVGSGGGGTLFMSGGGSGACFHGRFTVDSTVIARVELGTGGGRYDSGGAAALYNDNTGEAIIIAGPGTGGLFTTPGEGGVLEIKDNITNIQITDRYIFSNGNPGTVQGDGGASLYPPYGAGGKRGGSGTVGCAMIKYLPTE